MTRRSLHNYRHGTEEDVELRLDSRGIALLVDRELGSISTIGERSGSDVEGISDGGRSVENESMIQSKGQIGRASRIQRVTGGPRLSENRSEKS